MLSSQFLLDPYHTDANNTQVKYVQGMNEIVGGGGSVELELSRHLRDFSRSVAGKDQLVINQFAKVDLFDACPEGVKRAVTNMVGHRHFGYAEEATMQSFKWRFFYSAIFMVWCVGYLERS